MTAAPVSAEADVGPGTGALQEPAVTVTTLSTAQIDAGTAQSGLQAISGKAKCDVKVVALNYSTVGPKGEATNASGVLLMPAGNCANDAPLVAYAKGTDVQKPRTLANPQDPDTFLLTAMYAAQGYAVVATDYLGYAKSSLPYHPYLHADSEARSVLDSIRAARRALLSTGGSFSGKVMFTGYSQGGHSSMAAHRAAERDNPLEFNVVAGAHLAGPYNMSGSFKLHAGDRGLPVLRSVHRHLLAEGLRRRLHRRQHGLQGALRGDHREPAAEPDAELHHAGDHAARCPAPTARRRRRRATRCSRVHSSPTCRPTPTTRSSSTRRRTTCSAGARAPRRCCAAAPAIRRCRRPCTWCR